MRAADPDFAADVVSVIQESIQDLSPWLLWAQQVPTLEEEEEILRSSLERFQAREEFRYYLFERSSGAFVGVCGMVPFDWRVPRFDIGYWVRSSFSRKGYITEVAGALTDLCFERFGARRVQIRMSTRNERSAKVPERLGFQLEGVLRNDSLHPDGSPRDTKGYTRLAPSST